MSAAVALMAAVAFCTPNSTGLKTSDAVLDAYTRAFNLRDFDGMRRLVMAKANVHTAELELTGQELVDGFEKNPEYMIPFVVVGRKDLGNRVLQIEQSGASSDIWYNAYGVADGCINEIEPIEEAGN